MSASAAPAPTRSARQHLPAPGQGPHGAALLPSASNAANASVSAEIGALQYVFVGKAAPAKKWHCTFPADQAVPQPPLPAESDAPRQRLPPARRHAAGFSIVHLWNEWHSASAAGRHNRALVPVRARWCPPWDACAVRRVMNERRVQRQFCAKPAPTRSQAVDGVHVENKSAQSEQRARTWSPRLQQLRWGGVRTTRMLRRTAGTPQDTFPSAIKIAPALVRCPIVPQRSVAHLHAAAGEMGASCSHDLGVRTKTPPAAAFSTAPRDSYSVLVARPPSPETPERRLRAND